MTALAAILLPLCGISHVFVSFLQTLGIVKYYYPYFTTRHCISPMFAGKIHPRANCQRVIVVSDLPERYCPSEHDMICLASSCTHFEVRICAYRLVCADRVIMCASLCVLGVLSKYAATVGMAHAGGLVGVRDGAT